MRTVIASVTTTGSAGSATGTATVGIGDVGRLYAIQPIYDPGAPASTVMALSNSGRTVATTPATNSPRQYPILEQAYQSSGVAVPAGSSPQFEMPCITGTVTVTVTAANAGTGYGVILYLMDN